MKIALIISGRCVRYEDCLLPLLKKTQHDVNVFMSINDIEREYYDDVRKNLSPWLKEIVVKPYEFPIGFYNVHPNSLRQNIDGKLIPLHTMSMFFNDMNAFNMATKYADDNGFEYDNYFKFRADLIVDKFPEFIKSEELKLFSSVPRCDFRVPTVDRENKQLNGSVPIVSDAVAYGNRKSMKVYCDTYNFILEINEQWEGNYPINFEHSLTQQIYDKNVLVERFNYKYLIDTNRRMFDNYDSYFESQIDNNGNICGRLREPLYKSLTPRNMDDKNCKEKIPIKCDIKIDNIDDFFKN